MTRPSTIAAAAVLVCVPALVSFTSGNLSALGLGVRYLVALVAAGAAGHLLHHLWQAYGHGERGGST